MAPHIGSMRDARAGDLGDHMQHETKHSRSGAESAETAALSPGGGVETSELPDRTAQSALPAVEPDEQPAVASPPGGDRAEGGVVPTFLHEIARQMQEAVDRERGRISTEAADSLEAHVQKVRIRAAAEAEELRRLAEEDVGHIHEWSAAEAERLRRETDSRIGARREDLERHLRQHDALVEREISGASRAVEAYQAELDRFVGRLAGEQEPTEIAQLASQLPEPPRVEEIASAARADAIAELSRSEAADDKAVVGGDLVGVMDPGVISQPAEPKASEGVPDQSVTVGVADEQIVQEPQRRILGARSRVDLAIRLVVIIGVVALVAVLAFLVVTGQVSASSSGGPTPSA
jgi:hypothetical protein